MKRKYIATTVVGAIAGVVGYRIGKKEENDRKKNNKLILILVNHEVVIYNFRLELVERLLEAGYEVHISTPSGERVEKLKNMGAIIHDISVDRHGMNPADEIRILRYYQKLIKEIRPLIVLGYTIKPNIYGAIASRMNHIPFVANITGLGTAVENGGLQSKITLGLYRFAFGGKHSRIQRVFFQNENNERFFRENNIALDKHKILPGSGVNTERFPYKELTSCGDGETCEPVRFAFISRIMVEKGIDQYLDAAEAVKAEYQNTEFHIAGFFESEYDRSRMDKLCRSGVVIYDGNIEDVSSYMSIMHCIVHPTYYPEGLSNVLLEACSTGRPVITSDRPGCREVVEDNGYLVAEKSSEELIEAIERFIGLQQSEKELMGKSGRRLVEERFSRSIIVSAYMNEVGIAEKQVD